MDTTSPDISRLGFLLHDASRLLRKRFEANASRFGLSSSQWRLLVRVFKEEGISQARLAELLEIEPISVSRLIDRMEAAGWIERRADATDRRVRCIYLTDQSREIFAEMRSVAAGVFEGALTGLDDERRRLVFGALETIICNLNRDEAQPAAASDKAA